MMRQGKTSRAARGAPAAATATLGLLVLVVGAGAPAAAQTPGAQAPAATTPFASQPYRFAVALPAGCRHVKGPGTVDAVCSPALDPAKSAVASAARSLVLTVAAEPVAGTDDASLTALLERHSEADFRAELPQAVCGETDKTRIKIRNLRQTAEEGRVFYAADVVCAAVKFLRIAKRRAAVRHVIGPDMIYRVMARAPEKVFKKQRGTVDAFLASFRVLPAAQALTPVSKQARGSK